MVVEKTDKLKRRKKPADNFHSRGLQWRKIRVTESSWERVTLQEGFCARKQKRAEQRRSTHKIRKNEEKGRELPAPHIIGGKS